MKVRYVLRMIVLIVLIIVISGCSGEKDGQKNLSENVSEKQEIAQDNNSKEEKVDIDLTKLSSTMVYSEVYNMMTAPNDYVGKVVTMNGPLTIFTDEEGVKDYTAVLIADATACCQQGFEFVWNEHEYPVDFPDIGTEVTVTGIFETYERDGYTYCRLVSDNVKIGG